MSYLDLSTSPLHRMARRVRSLPLSASISNWRETFGPRATEGVSPMPEALSAQSVSIKSRWGYTWEIDADRNRLIARAPKGAMLQTKVYSLDRVKLSAFAALSSTIEE